MPDIRDILNALSDQDKHLYSHLRTVMRSEYLNAIHETVNIRSYTKDDDAFLDLIDIKIATLFDRAGKFNAAKGHIDEEAANQIEQQIVEAATGANIVPMSQGQKVLESYAPKSSAAKGW